jgi:hypothetical protein
MKILTSQRTDDLNCETRCLLQGIGRIEIDKNGIGSPTLVRKLKDVVKVAAGAFHTAVICGDGALYTFGKEDYGMLGLGLCEDQHEPRRCGLVWL